MTDNEKIGCDWKILANKLIPFCFFASMVIVVSIDLSNDGPIKEKSQIICFLIAIMVATGSFLYIFAVKTSDFINWFDKNEINLKIRDFVNKLFDEK